MTDHESLLIKPLDDKSDCTLWCQVVEAAVDRKELKAAFALKEVPTGVERTKFTDQCLKVSGIIVSTLEDYALRIVHPAVEKPTEMVEKLGARSNLKTPASRITKMVDLMLIRYTNPRTNITKLIDRMASIVE